MESLESFLLVLEEFQHRWFFTLMVAPNVDTAGDAFSACFLAELITAVTPPWLIHLLILFLARVHCSTWVVAPLLSLIFSAAFDGDSARTAATNAVAIVASLPLQSDQSHNLPGARAFCVLVIAGVLGTRALWSRTAIILWYVIKWRRLHTEVDS